MEQKKKGKAVSVSETSKLSKAKIAKLKKLSIKATNSKTTGDSPCTYHY